MSIALCELVYWQLHHLGTLMPSAYPSLLLEVVPFWDNSVNHLHKAILLFAPGLRSLRGVKWKIMVIGWGHLLWELTNATCSFLQPEVPPAPSWRMLSEPPSEVQPKVRHSQDSKSRQDSRMTLTTCVISWDVRLSLSGWAIESWYEELFSKAC